MLRGQCQQLRPFSFYDTSQFKYLQLISNNHHQVACVQHIQTHLQYVLKKIPFSQSFLKKITKMHSLNNNHLPLIHGACLLHTRTGWSQDPRRRRPVLKLKPNRFNREQIDRENVQDERQKIHTSILLFMEKCDTSLHAYTLHRKKTIKPFSNKEISEFVQQILSLLQLLQKQGLCHRDIKPQNILVDLHQKRYILADYDQMIDVNTDSHTHLQITTVQYSSKGFLEYVRDHGQRIDKQHLIDPFKLDVYALGLTLLFMCSTGRFDLQERKTLLYGNDSSHQDFIQEQRKRYIARNAQYKSFNSLVKMMLQQDEYKRDDFITLQLKNSFKQQRPTSEHSKSQECSTSKSSSKLKAAKEKKKREREKQRRAVSQRRPEDKMYAGLSAFGLMVFVLVCFL